MFNQYMAVSPGTIESAATLAQGRGRLRQPEHGRELHRAVRVRHLEVRPEHHAEALRRLLGRRPRRPRPARSSSSSSRTRTPGSTPGRTARSTAAGCVPSNAYAQLQTGGPGTLYYGLNTTVVSQIVSNLDGPLGDPNVRKALLMAIDREGIVKAGEAGCRGGRRTSLVTRSTWGGCPAAERRRHLRRAAEVPLRRREGQGARRRGRCRRPGDRHRHQPDQPRRDVIAQATAPGGRDIGLSAEIQTISPDQYTALFSDPAARKGIDLFFTAWYTSLADPMEMYGVLRTGEFSNYGDWSDPDVRRPDRQGDRRPDRRPGPHRPRWPTRRPSRTSSCRGCRSTPHRPRSGSATGSPASRRRSTTCTTRGRPRSEPRAEERR